MKFSARNQIKGIVKSINTGAVNSEVIIEIAPNVEVVSIITNSSVDALRLEAGKEAYAVMKASNVMVAID